MTDTSSANQPTPVPSRAVLCALAPLALAVIAALDTYLVLRRERAPSLPALAAFELSALAVGVVVSVPLLLVRRELHVALLRRLASRAVWVDLAIVVCDIAAVVAIAGYGTMRTASDLQRGAATVAVGAIYWGARLFARRFPVSRRALVLGFVLAVLVASEHALPFRSYDRTRCALDLCAICALTWLLSDTDLFTVRVRRVLGLVALACVLLADPCLRASQEARRLLHHDAAHARSMRYLFLPLFDWDGDGAPIVLGGHDCAPLDDRAYPGAGERPGDGLDQNCLGGDGVARVTHAFSPRLQSRPDVLLLSIDALRWDAAHLLVQTRRALGPHAIFTRAVSPAPRTADSLPATLRGRPTRTIDLAAHPTQPTDSPIHDTHPTLGDVLTGLGYRAFFVPTHRYLDHDSRVAAGFAERTTPAYDQLKHDRPGIGQAKPIVRAREVFEALDGIAREQREPLVLWAHLMDTHSPYYWGERESGPDSAEGYRHAITELDAKLAAFIMRFAAERGRPPLVALWGDHGEEFGEHGGNFHGSTVHAEQSRVTLLLAGPGIPSRRVDTPVVTTSLASTLLELIAGDVHPSFLAPSLLACLRGDPMRCPDVAVTELRFRGRFAIGYTTAHHRLVADPVFQLEELYDSERDPYEQEDVAEQRADRLREIRALAERWEEAH